MRLDVRLLQPKRPPMICGAMNPDSYSFGEWKLRLSGREANEQEKCGDGAHRPMLAETNSGCQCDFAMHRLK